MLFLRVAIIALFSSNVFQYNDLLASALITVAPRRSITRQQWGINRFFGHSTLPRPILILYATPDDDDTEKDASDSQPDDGAMTDADLDQQKLAFENMLKSSTGGSDVTSNTNVSILTTARKQRLEREIELLKQLDPDHPENNSDYSDLQNQELVVSELWSLWYGERGPMNERKLRDIEESLNNPSLWPDAEKKYMALIHEHCAEKGKLNLSNWVEPANRLATLLFLMGRFGESKQWCERILSTKPWHIGALSGVVVVCMKMGDKESVLKYSLMGLPNSSMQMRNRRQEWVQQNAQLAEKNLIRLEELNRKAYGEPDESGANYAEYDSSNESLTEGTDQIEDEMEEENSAWQ